MASRIETFAEYFGLHGLDLSFNSRSGRKIALLSVAPLLLVGALGLRTYIEIAVGAWPSEYPARA